MTDVPGRDGSYQFQGDFTEADRMAMQAIGAIDELKLQKVGLVTVRHAKRLASLQMKQMWLWSNVTRRAMRYIVQTPGLETLDVMDITGPGSMAHFAKAQQLHTFRANCGMSESDLRQLAQCETLVEVGAQSAHLTPSALAALLALPALERLDIEGTQFDDSMARRLCRSRTITSLSIGATKIGRPGLVHLAEMQQLRELDLWANRLVEDDFELLSAFPRLEYISLGGYEWDPSFDAAKLIPVLMDHPSLQQVWLDGVTLSVEQETLLRTRIPALRVS